MKKILNRRQMLRHTGLAGVGLTLAPGLVRAGQSANNKLNIAVIGCGGRGAANLAAVAETENIVALCDADARRAAKAFAQFPNAKRFSDFRKMFDQMHREIDAVVVSTPDHTHAPASVMAMKLGKHVYCEKPLAHSVHEARLMAQLAVERKLATQMGTQYNSSEGYRLTVEAIQSGAIGAVREVHCWTDRPSGWWPQGVARPAETPPVPSEVDWEAWLGPAPDRPYHEAYLPFKWRGWVDFGTGAMGDMASHITNVVFWALKLDRPISAEAEYPEGDRATISETWPTSCRIVYEFPARDNMPPVKLYWYDANQRPPADVSEGVVLDSNGSLFIGEKGKAMAGIGVQPIFYPKEDFAGYKYPDKWLERRPEIHADWIRGCKTGQTPGCHFGYSGPMTEALLVGNVALLLGRKVEYDAATGTVRGVPEAEKYLRPEYRQSWSL